MTSIVIANLADLCTFYLVMQLHPIYGESNPLIAPLWSVSPWLIVLYKAAGVLIMLLILSRVGPRARRWGITLAVAFALFGMATNTVSGLL